MLFAPSWTEFISALWLWTRLQRPDNGDEHSSTSQRLQTIMLAPTRAISTRSHTPFQPCTLRMDFRKPRNCRYGPHTRLADLRWKSPRVLQPTTFWSSKDVVLSSTLAKICGVRRSI